MRQRLVNLLTGSMGKKRMKHIGKALSISVINQVISSGTNFAFGVYLARTLTHTDFGLYSIGFAISLFYAGMGNALFLTQMVVNVPDKPHGQQIHYVASMGMADAVFCLITFICALFAMPVAGTLIPWLAQYVELGIAVAAASTAYHFKELFTRYAYTARKEIWALNINLVIATSLVCLVTTQYFSGIPLTAANALWLYAGAQLTGAIGGQLLVRLPFSTVRIKELYADVSEAWKNAKWALLTNIVYTLRGQAHTIVTAALAGPLGVAYLNATRLLVTPAIFVMPALSQVVLPRLATARTQNKERVLHLGLLFTAAILVASLIYSVVLLLYVYPITHLVLGDKYDPDLPLTLAWCVFICVHIISTNGVMVAQVLKRFRSILMINIITVIVMMCAIYLFNKMLGVPGIIYGMTAGDLFLSIIAWRLIAEECKNNQYKDNQYP